MSLSSRPSFPSLLVLATLALVPRLARAQSADAVQQAKAKRAECEKYFNVGDYAQALGDCKAAYLLDPEPDYLYSIAQVYRFSGDPGDAVHFYRIYLAKVGSALPENKRQAVEKLVDEQEAAETARTAPPTGTSAAEQAASRPASSSAPTQTARSSGAISPAAPSPSGERKPPWATDVLGDVLLGVGAAGLAVGGVAFALSNGSAQQTHSASTLDQFYSAGDAARSGRTFATWSTIVGGALFVTGIVHLSLHGFTSAERSDTALIISPTGLALTGGF